MVEDGENLCVIEAKLYSGFGEDATAGNQLRRGWIDRLRLASAAGKAFWLVAITNHATIAETEMRKQLAHSRAGTRRVSWLSWLEVRRLIEHRRDALMGDWCEDLLELLSRMGLAPCDGFGNLIDGELMRFLSASRLLDLHWVSQLVLHDERPAKAGFAKVMVLASDFGAFPTVSCGHSARPHGRLGGSRPALTAAEKWAENGATKWELKRN